MSRLRELITLGALALTACGQGGRSATLDSGEGSVADIRHCSAGWTSVSVDFPPDAAKSYRYLPFQVPLGTERIEVRYGWTDRSALPSTPINGTTVDLGLWDERGLRDGFRGWGGSRQGRIDQGGAPVFIEANAADRGFYPGPIGAGVWNVELGLAATGDAGADVIAEFRCLTEASGVARPPGPRLNAASIIDPQPGWFAADFHMHGYHSNPAAPDWDGVIEQARQSGLRILMLTDYVVDRHHRELAEVQASNPDLLLWPGREVITYFGHANVLGEVEATPDYRQGWDGITLGLIQDQAVAEGALFQINHPTTFPPPVFSNLCRGCAFELDAFVKFEQTHLVEVVNASPVATASDFGLPIPGEIENPFIATAITWWLDKLRAGYRMTAVSGSDSKGVDAPEDRPRKGYGSSATRIGAENLSRTAIRSALLDGHAYIQVRGVHDSPEAALAVTTSDGQSGSFGAALNAEEAEMEITLTGAMGQLLTVFRDATPVVVIPVTADPFVYSMPVFRVPLDEGPLGTIWRFEVRDRRSRTIISNPVYLSGS